MIKINTYLCSKETLKRMNTMKRLTPKEQEIMMMFWQHGSMFIREILDHYQEPRPHYNTVATLVKILEDKGFLKHRAYGNTYVYTPIIGEKEYKTSAMSEMVSQLYNNSYTSVVSQFIEDEAMNLDELKALIQRIEDAQKS